MAARRGDRSCLAVTRPGLESVCADEARSLGLHVRSVDPGVVAFDATERQLYVAVRWLRTATRVLVVVAELHAPTFGALERGLARLDWVSLLGAKPHEVRVRASRAQLHHTGAVAERVETAIADTLALPAPTDPGPDPRPDRGAAPAQAEASPVRVDVRVTGETAQIRLDATGEVADRRGWRLETAKAPLPPTVASAVLHTIGWDGSVPLLDPMCGAGTIPIEAALLAARRPPTADRTYAVEGWPSFAPGTWASAGTPPARHDDADDPTTGDADLTGPRVLAGDRDAGAVAATAANAGRAGVGDLVDVAQGALSAAAGRCTDLPPGWVVTNPPWGDRMGGAGDLRDLHAALGALVRGLGGWRLAVVTADPATARHVGLPLEQRWRTQVGGTAVHLLTSPMI